MVRDIEEGKIGIVLFKDLSRLGRNNAMVAYYTEIFFPDNDIRFVCVSEGPVVKHIFQMAADGLSPYKISVKLSEDKYEDEQKEIKKRILELENVFKDQENEENNTVEFLNIVRQYSEITELNKAILKDLIESIVIHNAEGSGIKERKQKIEINYKFIGTVKLNA